ncbi:MAG: hypothetical protein FWF45_00745 [Coriobacteriia bacterium]|nr:hypothetical protein [Coriobacteriia bacterium]
MLGHLGFSWIGAIYLLALWIPNIIWARHKPTGYDASGENPVLVTFERIGQVFSTVAILCFNDLNPHGFNHWSVWLVLSILLMILYECFWIRYFHGGHTLQDFYRPLFGFPAPGASLPVLAFLFLGIYGKLIWLIGASVILGVGHIGIHLQHARRLNA